MRALLSGKLAASALLAIVIGTLGAAQADALPNSVRYACPASDDLTVQRTPTAAHVNFAGQSYDLQRKRSSIGEKYISSKAALIIDGSSAVFVTEDHLGLGTCSRADPIASAR